MCVGLMKESESEKVEGVKTGIAGRATKGQETEQRKNPTLDPSSPLRSGDIHTSALRAFINGHSYWLFSYFFGKG
jgi:hypothetical protein